MQLDEGTHDALIAERAGKDDEIGEAFALLYTIDEENDGSIAFDETIFGLGEAPSLFGADEFEVDQLESLDDFDEDLPETSDEESDERPKDLSEESDGKQ